MRIAPQQGLVNHCIQLRVVKTGTPALEVGQARLIAVIRVIDQRAQAGVRMRLHPAAAATYQQVKFTLAHCAVDLVTSAGDDFGVNPRLHQRRLHGDSDVKKWLIGEYPQRGIKAVGISRFRQQLFARATSSL